MKKRLISMALATAMVGTVCAGCGNNANQSNGTTAGNDNGSTESTASGDVTNLVMQIPVLGDTPAGLGDVETAINEITEKEIGVHVTLLPGNAYNLNNETSLAVSSSEQLDITLSIFSGVGSLVEQGILIPLDDLIKTNGQDILEKCGDTLVGGNYGDALYGIPIAYVNGADWAFVADKAVLDEAGVTVDEDKYYTADELEEIFDKVMDVKGSSYHIFAGASGNNGDVRPFVALNTVDDMGTGIGILYDDNFNTDGEIQCFFESDEFKTMCETSYRWAQKGFFSADAATTTEAAASQMAAGVALGEFFNYEPSVAANYAMQIGRDCVVLKTVPAFMYSKAYQSSLWGITTSCHNPEKAMDMLNLMYKNADICNLLMHGIEGVSYNIVEQDADGTVIEMLPDAPYSNVFGVFGDRFSWYVTAPATTTTNKEEKEMSDAITRKSVALGFVPSYANVSTEYTNVTAVINQYIGILDSGAVDPDKELPEFISKLKDAGIDTILEDVRTQYAQWQQNNQ